MSTIINDPVLRFCAKHGVDIHRDFGIGDVTVRGPGVRLRISERWIDERVFNDGWSEKDFLAFVEVGIRVARTCTPTAAGS